MTTDTRASAAWQQRDVADPVLTALADQSTPADRQADKAVAADAAGELSEPLPIDKRAKPQRWPTALLIVAATSWTIAAGYTLWLQTVAGASVAALVQSGAMLSVPLMLVAVVYLSLTHDMAIRSRDGERTTMLARYDGTLVRLAARAASLDDTIATASLRLGDLHARAANDVAAISTLVDGDVERMTAQVEALRRIATGARAEVALAVADLPRADAYFTAIQDKLTRVGAVTHDATQRLGDAVGAMWQRADAVGQAAGTIAHDLEEHAQRIEQRGTAAATRLSALAATMRDNVDGALAHADTAADALQRSSDAHAAAIVALVDQARAALAHSGGESVATLEADVRAANDAIAALAGLLASHATTAAAMLADSSTQVGAIDRQLATLDDAHDARLSRLADLRDAVARNVDVLGTHAERAASAVATVDRTVGELGTLHDAGMAAFEQVASLGPQVTALTSAGATLAGDLERSSAAAARIDDALIPARELLATLGDAEQASGAVVTRLADAGDAATQAAAHARAAGDDVAAHTADAIAARLNDAVAAALTRVEDGAREAVRDLNDRIAVLRDDDDTADQPSAEALSQRVALLIESLNSTAIDVAKLLSNEVTDAAWAAYLRGDRGVFTRRAVRLLDNGDARQILQHYEAEGEFREQVNRYVHDFEAMLRTTLATRGGSTLAVTLLSSDMGKLYVALAQAIQRLRT